MSAVGSHIVPEGELQAALFDVDGTLVDTMGAFIPSWHATAEKFDLQFSDDFFWSAAGKPLPDIVKELWRSQREDEATEEFIRQFLEEKQKVHHERETQTGAPPAIGPVVEIARRHAEAGVPIVAATSGIRSIVIKHLTANGLMKDLFSPDRIICAEELPPGRGKPQPDIFLRAAEIAGADPAFCVVYEDAESGFQGAWRAGCQVIDVRDLEGYPLSPALRETMEKQRAARQWLTSEENSVSH